MNTIQDRIPKKATRVPRPAYRIDPFAENVAQPEKIMYQTLTASPHIIMDSAHDETPDREVQAAKPARIIMTTPINLKNIERALFFSSRTRMDHFEASRTRMNSMCDRIPRKEKARTSHEITPIANKRRKCDPFLGTNMTDTLFLDRAENSAKVARNAKQRNKLMILVKGLQAALLEVWEDPKKKAKPSRENVMKSVKQWTIGRVTWSGIGTEDYWQKNNLTNIGSVYMGDPERMVSKKDWQKYIYKKYYKTIIRKVARNWAGEHGDFVVQTTMYGDKGYCKPHRDKHDVDCQYLIGFGDYKGGELEVELSNGKKETVDIRHKIVRMDGRLRHRVKSWTGNRQSVIWYKVWDRRYLAAAPTKEKIKIVFDFSGDLA